MDSDEYDYGNDNRQKDPPAQLNALFNAACHRSRINEHRFLSSGSDPDIGTDSLFLSDGWQASTTTDQTPA
jgi:hypothetical protein